MTVNFEKISNTIHKHFDIDLMDIFRATEGSAERVEIYSNVPCNIEINQEDNPDPTAIDVVPIISTLVIHMQNWVDVRNNDYIIAKKMSNDGQVLAVYSGVCGEPAVWQSRKTINMQMSAVKDDVPVTPPPPKEQSDVRIYFRDISDGQEIKSPVVQVVQQGVTANIFPAVIENYSLEQSFLDGQQVETGAVTIQDPKAEGHEVIFKYSQVQVISSFRVLAKGAYTMDDGSLAFGLHLYAKTPILGVSDLDNGYIIKTQSNKIDHEELGNINLSIGTKIKTNLGSWLEITTTPQKLEDNSYMFETKFYTPTAEEQNAYVTNWYSKLGKQ